MIELYLQIFLLILLVLETFYIFYLVRRVFFFSENIYELTVEVENYREHLESLYDMEIYHGDSTIHALIEHTKEVSEKLKDFEDFYSLIEDPQEVEQEENIIEKKEGIPEKQ